MAKEPQMKAKYVGDPMRDGDGPDTVFAFGVDWEKGKTRTVPVGAEGRVRENTHWEVTTDEDGANQNDRARKKQGIVE